VLALRDVEGLSNEAAAAALGESVPALKSRLHRARMLLREMLTAGLVGPPPVPGAGPAAPAQRSMTIRSKASA
jgi:hypothetical protein